MRLIEFKLKFKKEEAFLCIPINWIIRLYGKEGDTNCLVFYLNHRRRKRIILVDQPYADIAAALGVQKIKELEA